MKVLHLFPFKVENYDLWEKNLVNEFFYRLPMQKDLNNIKLT